MSSAGCGCTGNGVRNFIGQNYVTLGYLVLSVGQDEKMIRDNIRNKEEEDQRLDQIKLGC